MTSLLDKRDHLHWKFDVLSEKELKVSRKNGQQQRLQTLPSLALFSYIRLSSATAVVSTFSRWDIPHLDWNSAVVTCVYFGCTECHTSTWL
jgi:hypothetical protein